MGSKSRENHLKDILERKFNDSTISEIVLYEVDPREDPIEVRMRTREEVEAFWGIKSINYSEKDGKIRIKFP